MRSASLNGAASALVRAITGDVVTFAAAASRERVLWLELKREGGKLSGEQQRVIRGLLAAGFPNNSKSDGRTVHVRGCRECGRCDTSLCYLFGRADHPRCLDREACERRQALLWSDTATREDMLA